MSKPQIPGSADIMPPAQRSALMARIAGRGNRTTELAMIRLLRAGRITGWRRHLNLRWVAPDGRVRFIRPDFVFPARRLVVFVDGCFWHGCPLHSTLPKNNSTFWHTKIEGNRQRDNRSRIALRKKGWKVVRIWEHALRDAKGQARVLKRIANRL
jgi:DNA mismatch endonuclease (patch repair protein)